MVDTHETTAHSAESPSEADIWAWLEAVPDPEIPVISVVDLGVIRGVEVTEHEVTVTITPTYTGCPAMAMITRDIKTALSGHGIEHLAIETQLAPAWTTDWISADGLARLEQYGIAQPRQSGVPARCPRCHSNSVERVSQFGSTPCKAQWRCKECLEPFDYFKCL